VADPYREVVEGSVTRLAVRARPSFAVRVGLPLLAMIYSGGIVPLVVVFALAQRAQWSTAMTALALVGAFLGLFSCASVFVALLGKGAHASRNLELDRDRRVLRVAASRGIFRAKERASIPFASIRSVYAFDGCVRIDTAEKVYEPIDINHRRTKADAERIAKRIRELVVRETGEMLPRVRIESGVRVETDGAIPSESEREAEIERRHER
jgi:hypothetical protein